jgi:SAM-dependent methyltransferase
MKDSECGESGHAVSLSSVEVAPGITDQQTFWDEWNSSYRQSGVIDGYMSRQIAEARRAAQALVTRGEPLRILDVGCGIGWLAATLTEFGEVTGTDLSEKSVSAGRAQYPDVRFVAGDFETVDVGGSFDLVLSADTISHVADHRRFVDRMATLLRPGGRLLLMSQNGFVWRRSSYLAPQKPGQIRNWPTLGTLRELLDRQFEIISVRSIAPGGDRGVLRLAHWSRAAASRVKLAGAVQAVQERLRIGRELVINAERRSN